MPALEDLVEAILALEAAHAQRNRDEVDSRPGAPADEAAIQRAEEVRGVTFPPSYRSFLAP